MQLETTQLNVNHFDRDDQVYVVVTPNDGIDDGPSETSPIITIVNTAPTTPSIQLLPHPADVGQDDLICMVDVPSVDDDGDAIFYTYEWTDSFGVIQQSTIESVDLSDAFPAALTSAGIWTCEVTPFDGTDDGGTAMVMAGARDCSSWGLALGTMSSPLMVLPLLELPNDAGWFKSIQQGMFLATVEVMNTLMDTVLTQDDFEVRDATAFGLTCRNGVSILCHRGQNSSALPSASLGLNLASLCDNFRRCQWRHILTAIVDTVQTGVASITSNDQLSVAGNFSASRVGDVNLIRRGCRHCGLDWLQDTVLYTADFVPSGTLDRFVKVVLWI